MTFQNPIEFVAALGLAGVRQCRTIADEVATLNAELAAACAYQVQLQAQRDQDEERRQEALDALEMAQDRLVSAEARASLAECEARRLGRVVAEFQAQLKAMARGGA